MSKHSQEIYTEEKLLKARSGLPFLPLIILLFVLDILIFIKGVQSIGSPMVLPGVARNLIIFSIFLFFGVIIGMSGFKVVKPNHARAFTLFGLYKGVIKKPGFYYVNPFASSITRDVPRNAQEMEMINSVSEEQRQSQTMKTTHEISLKTQTLLNNRQKINDELGNPIEIGIAVIWRIDNVTKAMLNVEDYLRYLSIQCDAALRETVRSYPYDVSENNDNEQTLRGSSSAIAKHLGNEIQAKVTDAGLEIIEARITHLAYAPEIAAAMLQRQQASAIIDARQKIVEGAVGMVDMALKMLKAEDIVELDTERKAQMVSNLMVVLCGNKDAQPIVNSGSLY